MKELSSAEIAALKIAHDYVVDYRASVPTRVVPPAAKLDEAVSLFRQPLGEEGQLADQVIAELVHDAEPGINHMTSGKFFGYVIGGSFPVGVAADYVTSGWGQNAGSSFETPSISGIERAVGDWVLDLIGLPRQSGVGLVSGATLANLQCIMSARHVLLKTQGWNVEDDGMFGAPLVPVLAGADAHSAPLAGVRHAGFGSKIITRVATDDQGRMRPAALEEALKKCANPPLVILQAGQINTGASDPFEEIIPLIHKYGGWAHVDGAFGLWLNAVPELQHYTQGVEQADSWAVDLHKWLSVPYDSGVCIVRDRSALVAAMSAWGAYLPQTSDHWEPADSTLELSRRARGVPAYAVFKQLGKSGVKNLIANHVKQAQYLADKLRDEVGLTVPHDVTCNQVAVWCGEGDKGAEQTKTVLQKVQARGKVYPSHGEWRGRPIIRCSICNYSTDQSDIDLLANEIISAWRTVKVS